MAQTWRCLVTLGPRFRRGATIECSSRTIRSIAGQNGLKPWECACPSTVPPGEAWIEKLEKREAAK